MVVRRHDEDLLEALVLRVLARHLVRLVVLIGGDEEVRVALLAGEVGGAGVGRDQDRAAVGHRLHHRDQDVGEDRADHEVDLVPLHVGLGLADRDVRLELVVLHDQLDLAPAELAAERLQRKLEAVALLHAERGGRPRQRGQDADLELVLGGGLRGERERRSSQHDGQFLHVHSSGSLLRPLVIMTFPCAPRPTASLADHPKIF